MRNLRVRPWRFNELQKSLDGISQKVLTDSLRSMESDGIVTRTAYPEVPPRVEYALSKLGESMLPIINAMEAWGIEYKNSTKKNTDSKYDTALYTTSLVSTPCTHKNTDTADKATMPI